MLSRALSRCTCPSSRAISTRASIQRCLADYSVEVTPQAAKKVESFAHVEGLKRGTIVNVTYLPGSDSQETVDLCKRLKSSGMRPVAHVPARSFKDLSYVDSYLDRLVDVGVEEVLVLGGAPPQPVGSLSEAMQILESGLLQKYGISRVGVAAHPEGHPDVSDEIMTEAMLRKAMWAKAEGVELYYASQFCFMHEPIISWENRLRQLLIARLGSSSNLPEVHLGVAGPTKMQNLIKFGIASGVGPSIRFLTKYTGNVAKLLTQQAPDELITGIAEYQAEEDACLIRRLHFYSFGGLKSTLKWANGAEDGRFDLHSMGFQVLGA